MRKFLVTALSFLVFAAGVPILSVSAYAGSPKINKQKQNNTTNKNTPPVCLELHRSRNIVLRRGGVLLLWFISFCLDIA